MIEPNLVKWIRNLNVLIVLLPLFQVQELSVSPSQSLINLTLKAGYLD